MERAARVSGSRFGYMVGDTALVALALYRFALDRSSRRASHPSCRRCSCARRRCTAPGCFRRRSRTVYKLEGEDLFLVGTAEVPLGGLHADEIIDGTPSRSATSAYSSCFRREAGAAGKDTRGMFRVHQFNKVEQFVFIGPTTRGPSTSACSRTRRRSCRSWDYLPRRRSPTGDTSGLGEEVRRRDLVPVQERYRETRPCSNTTDFQARRMGARWRSDHGLVHPHTLNGTAAVGRMVLALLENWAAAPDGGRGSGFPGEVG